MPFVQDVARVGRKTRRKAREIGKKVDAEISRLVDKADYHGTIRRWLIKQNLMGPEDHPLRRQALYNPLRAARLTTIPSLNVAHEKLDDVFTDRHSTASAPTPSHRKDEPPDCTTPTRLHHFPEFTSSSSDPPKRSRIGPQTYTGSQDDSENGFDPPAKSPYSAADMMNQYRRILDNQSLSDISNCGLSYRANSGSLLDITQQSPEAKKPDIDEIFEELRANVIALVDPSTITGLVQECLNNNLSHGVDFSKLSPTESQPLKGDGSTLDVICQKFTCDLLSEIENTVHQLATLQTPPPKHAFSPSAQAVAGEGLPVVPGLSPDATTPSTPSVTTPSPIRPDRIGQVITETVAQGHFGPEACIFSANLPSDWSDDDIKGQLHEKLKHLGEVYIVVSRDKRGLPSAFLQFTKPEHANAALALSNTMIIGTRRVRCERPKANFVLIISKLDGRGVSNEDLIGILHDKGPIVGMWHPSETDRAVNALPDGSVCVKFKNFTDFQDARRVLRGLRDFRIEPLTRYASSKPAEAHDYEEKKSVRVNDVTSVFVGNLREDCELHEIAALFGTAGEVSNVQKFKCLKGIRDKQYSLHGLAHLSAKFSYYAFVEYAQPQAVVNATKQLNGAMLRGYRLRVELRAEVRKEVDRIRAEVNAYIANTVVRTGYIPDNASVLAAFPALLGTNLAVINGVFNPRPANMSSTVPYYVLHGI